MSETQDQLAKRFHSFDVEFPAIGAKSRVWLDGKELKGLRDVTVRTDLDRTEITLTLIANVNRKEATTGETFPVTAFGEASDKYTTKGCCDG